MVLPIAFLHDHHGILTGVRFLKFEIEGYHAGAYSDYNTILEIHAPKCLISSAEVIELSIAQLSMVYGTDTGYLDNIHSISRVREDGSIATDAGEKPLEAVQLIGLKEPDDSKLYSLNKWQQRYAEANPNSTLRLIVKESTFLYDNNARYGDAGAERWCYLVDYKGKYHRVPFTSAINLARTGKIKLGNVNANSCKTVSTYVGLLNCPDADMGQHRDTVNSLRLFNSQDLNRDESLSRLPEQPTVIIPEGIADVCVSSDVVPPIIKNLAFPSWCARVQVRDAYHDYDTVRLPETGSSMAFEAGCVNNLITPRKIQGGRYGANVIIHAKGIGNNLLTLNNCSNIRCSRFEIGSAPKLEGVCFCLGCVGEWDVFRFDEAPQLKLVKLLPSGTMTGLCKKPKVQLSLGIVNKPLVIEVSAYIARLRIDIGQMNAPIMLKHNGIDNLELGTRRLSSGAELHISPLAEGVYVTRTLNGITAVPPSTYRYYGDPQGFFADGVEIPLKRHRWSSK